MRTPSYRIDTLTTKRPSLDSGFDPGCVLYFPGLLGGGSTIYDRSPYGNDGTIEGASWIKTPSGLWALSFNGSSDDVDCGSDSSIKPTSALSVELWFRRAANSAVEPFFDDGEPTAPNRDGIGCTIRATGEIWFSFGNDASYTSSKTSGTYDDDVWHHLVNTWAGGTLDIFIDGAEAAYDGAQGTQAALRASDKNFFFGQDASDSIYWGGYLALIRMYNVALTPAQILSHFNQERHLFGAW